MLEIEVDDASAVDVLDTEYDLLEELASFRFGETVDALALEVVEDVASLHELCDDVGLESETEHFHQLHHV